VLAGIGLKAEGLPDNVVCFLSAFLEPGTGAIEIPVRANPEYGAVALVPVNVFTMLAIVLPQQSTPSIFGPVGSALALRTSWRERA
jgi:hypothetical protein